MLGRGAPIVSAKTCYLYGTTDVLRGFPPSINVNNIELWLYPTPLVVGVDSVVAFHALQRNPGRDPRRGKHSPSHS